MDWSLVLASQNIPATILHDDAGWRLEVATADYDHAVKAIALYQKENRRWTWRPPPPVEGLLFHWGSLVWVFCICWIHIWAAPRREYVEAIALMNNRAVLAGEWWRVFTAISLHGDLAHLAANASIGLVLLGLAMARYGAGLGSTAAFLAGAGGNLLGLLLYTVDHRGLGASGMVMGALGLIAVPVLPPGKRFLWGTSLLWRALLAAVLMFVLMGTNPGTDVLAHLGGFCGGVLLALMLNAWPEENRGRRLLDRLLVAVLPLFVVLTWTLALARGRGMLPPPH